jgi:hypothetical protein
MKKDRPYPVWLGSWDTKQARIDVLDKLARKYAGTTRQGVDVGDERGNVSKLIQMIADGELKLRKR